jgi:chromosome segregation ATPase
LDKEIKEIREQCMKVRAACDEQEKTIGGLKETKMELEDDRRFLDFEIRDCRL